ncbi:MAG TPA: NAD(P)-binding oxidoreductase [Trebonia sp.]|nr:NAD(P)-binding oxidoreductase [Trebonia sp.]
MQLTILAASGGTGQELTRQALERGHTVTAIARRPARIAIPDSAGLRRVAADVRDPGSIKAALTGSRVVLSGLGVADGDPPGVLTAGARAVTEAHPDMIIWLGALGTGPSAQAGGLLVRTLFLAMAAKLEDKVTADTTVLRAGGTVFHAGPLTGDPIGPTRRTVGLDAYPRRLFPARVSRATVAAAMLDEAEDPRYAGTIAIPLQRGRP